MVGKLSLLMVLMISTVEGQASYNGGSWLPAHATFYGESQNPTSLGGACGYDNTFHSGFGINTAALSGAVFKGGQVCGACFQITCDLHSDPQWCLPGRPTVTVTATNFCPPNNNGGWCDPPHVHFDMSLPAFSRVARVGSEGIVPILYRRYMLDIPISKQNSNDEFVIISMS